MDFVRIEKDGVVSILEELEKQDNLPKGKSVLDGVPVDDNAFPLGQRCPHCGQLIHCYRKNFSETIETK